MILKTADDKSRQIAQIEQCLAESKLNTPQKQWLTQFTQVARLAINHLQDVMRIQKAHLIAISPASTVFRFGQMLQAGHHPPYTIYDRACRGDKFVPAFSISGHEVCASDGAQSYRIAIR